MLNEEVKVNEIYVIKRVNNIRRLFTLVGKNLQRVGLSSIVMGFVKIGSCDALHVEMWDMYLGLAMAWRDYIPQLIVESDSSS